ncbi:MAG: hypothetical protein ACL93V_16580 [Candidatus Electrothrix sp. YB6]
MTWQKISSFIVERVVATITGLVIIAIILPSILPPEMLPADAGWLQQHAKVFCFSVVGCEVAFVFQYWSKKMRVLGWVLLAVTFALVAFG